MNADVWPIDPNQFAPSKGQPSGGQDHKKFLCLQWIGRSVYLKFGTACGNVEKNAASAPCSINTHYADSMLVFKPNTVCASLVSDHVQFSSG